jgi:hypothetical protein
MSTFKILKQQHPSGCIPACAASVLRHLGIPRNPDWSEAGLFAMYNHQLPTGFDTLKHFLDAQPEMKGWEVIIREGAGSVLKILVTSIVSQHGPALIPVVGNPVHCVVVIEPDENGAIICDPSPNQPDQELMTWDDIENKKKPIGGLLHFKKIQS